MSADFTKGTVSCYQDLEVTKFETNFKDQQTVKNRTIKALKAKQSPDFQQRGHKQSQQTDKTNLSCGSDMTLTGTLG